MKAALYITAGILILAIGIGAGLFFFMRTNPDDVPQAIRDFFPFGSPDWSAPPSGVDVPVETGGASSETDVSFPMLRQLHTEPVAGISVFSEQNTNTIRFIERATGNVFEITERELTPRRITNTTVPRVQEAFFGGPDIALLRYLADDDETVQSFVADIAAAISGEGVGELTGSFLPQGARSLALFDGLAVFYTIPEEERGYIAGIKSDTALSILPIPFTEWQPQWISSTRIALTSKPSAQTAGALYILRTDTGAMERVLGGIPGLTTLLSADGERVLIGASAGTGMSLGVLERSRGTSQTLPFHTLPEKCVWSAEQANLVYCAVPEQIPSASYPDAWYQGRIAFSDNIWAIDAANGSAEIIAQLVELARTPIDATNLSLSPDESLLVFMDKQSGSPWSLALPAESGE